MKKLNIINHALSELGMEPAATVNDTSAATVISRKLDILMALLLRSNIWRFAIRQKVDTTPIVLDISTDYKYTYALPNDYGRLYKVSDSNQLNFEIINTYICSDSKPISYYYVVNSVNYSIMPASFTYVLGLYAAADAAIVLTQNVGLANYLNNKFLKEKANAILLDDMERSVTTRANNSFNRIQFI